MTLGDISILAAIDSPSIWAGWFRNRRTWEPWRVFLSVLFQLPLDAAGLKLFRECTGRTAPPAGGFLEAWLICGRRAGKSFTLALVAVYLAVFRDWAPYLAPGEVACVKIIACDRKQARAIHRYCRALLTKVPAFADLIERDTDDEIALTNSVVIEVQTASFRGTRSYTIIAGLLDEFAYARTDEFAANVDVEILAAIRPSMATVPGAMLLVASSPYAKRGALYDAYRQHFGQTSDVLVWKAPTRTMNPTVPQSFIDREMERDPARAAAEYGAEFRTDIETFLDRELIEAAISKGVVSRPPQRGIHYLVFVDPSGGRGDSFTAAVGHIEGNLLVIDCVYERRAPFDSDQTITEVCALAKSYGAHEVFGDDYGADLTVSAFRRRGLTYKRPMLGTGDDRAKISRSEIYLNVIGLFTSGRPRLPDSPRIVLQIAALERRTARSGHDSVDHPRSGADDLANVVCGALVLLASKASSSKMILSDKGLRQAASMPPRQRFGGALGPPQGPRPGRWSR